MRDGWYRVDASVLRDELVVLKTQCAEVQAAVKSLRTFRQYLATSIFCFDEMEPYPMPSLLAEVSDDICRLVGINQRLRRQCDLIEKRLKGLDDHRN